MTTTRRGPRTFKAKVTGKASRSKPKSSHYEVNGHKLFNWNRYYVDPDFTKKVGHYVEPDYTKKTGHYGSADHNEAKDYVDYMPME